MAFKLLESAQVRWRSVNGENDSKGNHFLVFGGWTVDYALVATNRFSDTVATIPEQGCRSRPGVKGQLFCRRSRPNPPPALCARRFVPVQVKSGAMLRTDNGVNLRTMVVWCVLNAECLSTDWAHANEIADCDAVRMVCCHGFGGAVTHPAPRLLPLPAVQGLLLMTTLAAGRVIPSKMDTHGRDYLLQRLELANAPATCTLVRFPFSRSVSFAALARSRSSLSPVFGLPSRACPSLPYARGGRWRTRTADLSRVKAAL